jgi:hypothetical protein
MLDQNSQQPNGSPSPAGSGASQPADGSIPFDLSRPLDGAAKFIPVRTAQLPSPAAPISVSAPRSATAVPIPASPSQATASKLSDLIARADRALPRLEARLSEEHAATDRAAWLTADIEERLKLGVRMLQAFEVQSSRGESIASRAMQAIEEAERVLAETARTAQVALQSDADRIVTDKLAEIERDLEAQRERFRQFESGAGLLAQEKLGQIQGELDVQLGRLKRADLDATALADDRLSAIRALCEAQVDRISRASGDSVADIAAAGQRVFGEAESHIARLLAAQQAADNREAERLEKFEAELAARLDAARAKTEEAAAAAESHAARVTSEAATRLESELNWRIERVREVEARIEHAANTALAAVDAELGARLSQVDGLVRRADLATARFDEAMARMEEAGRMIERSERATAALAGLSGESARLIETLAARVGDATALREVLGKLVHELAAAREVVQGDMRRMRDELGWLVGKSERLTGELVERAGRAASTAESIRAVTDAAEPILAELALWSPLLQDPSADRVRPITTAIAAGVRDELASDMHGVASVLRQLAARADGAFKTVSIETDMLREPDGREDPQDHATSARDLARSFERQLSQLGPISTFSSSTDGLLPPVEPGSAISAKPPTLSANRPLDLEA